MSDNTTQKIQTPMNQQQFMQMPIPDDEINLLDLWKVLMKRKKLIFFCTLLVTISALIYSIVSPIVYRAEIFFLPPAISDVQPLNIQNIQNIQSIQSIQSIQNMRNNSYLHAVSAESVYLLFKQNLDSKKIRRFFFSNSEELAGVRFSNFTKSLRVHKDKLNQNKLSVSFEWGDAQQASDILNNYCYMVEQNTIRQLVNNMVQSISSRIRSLENEVTSKRKIAEQRRYDRIAQLSEALHISESIKQDKQISQNNASNPPLYYKGIKALEVEISLLRTRKSDDPFINGLRDIQEELEILRAVNIDKTKLHAMTLDQKAYPPEYKIKPKRTFIVIIGFILGIIVGIFAAFFINFIENYNSLIYKD